MLLIMAGFSLTAALHTFLLLDSFPSSSSAANMSMAASNSPSAPCMCAVTIALAAFDRVRRSRAADSHRDLRPGTLYLSAAARRRQVESMSSSKKDHIEWQYNFMREERK